MAKQQKLIDIVGNLLETMPDLTGEFRHSHMVYGYIFALGRHQEIEEFKRLLDVVRAHAMPNLSLSQDATEFYVMPEGDFSELSPDEFAVMVSEYTVDQFKLPIDKRNEDYVLSTVEWWGFLGYITALLDADVLKPVQYEAIKVRTPLAQVDADDYWLPRIKK